jgi:hypothetical protein
MTEASDQPVTDRLNDLRAALRADPSPDAERALYQCDRLEQALKFWHAEGIRFAAFTIDRLVCGPDSRMSEAIRRHAAALREALAGAGHRF